MNALPRIGAAALTVLAAACVGAPAPRVQYFTLASPNPGVALPASASPSVFVGPVSVPSGVDRKEMVLDTGPNEVQISDDYRWAEPLREGIARVLAETLGRELGTSRVLYSRIAQGMPVDYRVSVEVQRFDSSLARGATVDASWSVSTTGGAPAKTGRTVAHEPDAAGDPAGLAAAHGRALQRVAGDIAKAIRALRAKKETSARG